MSARLIDGKACAASIESSLKPRVEELISKQIYPHLAVIIVGDDPASHVYVRAKERACERLGIKSTKVQLSGDVDFQQVKDQVKELNDDSTVHGILVQSPLPKGMNEVEITDLINPIKDVDGFHASNLGKLVQGDTSGLLPCTPAGVMKMLDWADVSLSGKRAVVIGRSRIVGMPQALLLSQKGADATVTIVHSRTDNPEEICRQADVLIAAVGVAEMVTKSWVKPGAVVVDVGVNRVEDTSKERGYRLAGDVESSVSEIASALSPVPGGVGPMTIAMLMNNTVRAAEEQNSS